MPAVRARFIEPMLLQLATKLPEGAQWLYELKLDGYRAGEFRPGSHPRASPWDLFKCYALLHFGCTRC